MSGRVFLKNKDKYWRRRFPISCTFPVLIVCLQVRSFGIATLGKEMREDRVIQWELGLCCGVELSSPGVNTP